MQREGKEAGTGTRGGGVCRAEGAEVPVFSWSGFFYSSIVGSARIPRASCRIYGDIKDASFTFINDTVMRRVGRSEFL